MHLENHLGVQPLGLEPLPDAYHSQLDDVGLGALDGGVDGVALGKSAYGGVARDDVGQVAAAAEQRLGIAVLPCLLLGLLHVGVHFGESSEVVVDELAGLVVAYVHALGQSEGGDAIDNAEVGLLGLLALSVDHGRHLLVPYLRCSGPMDVETLAKGLDHVLIARQMGHNAQFDLAVVGRKETAAGLGNEAFAYLLAVVVAHGNVLQIGVARRETAGGCNGLIERGVDATGAWIHQFGQRFHVSSEQFLESTVVQDVVDDGCFVAQLLQHFLGSDVLSCLGLLGFLHDFHFAEEDVSHLFGAGDVERPARQLVGMALVLLHALGEAAACSGQGGRVEAHAVELHIGQHPDERHLNIPEQPLGAGLSKAWLEHVFQPQGDVGIFARIFINLPGGEVAHVALAPSLGADELFDVYSAVVEQGFGHVIHVVMQLGLQYIVSQHRVEHGALNVYTILPEHLIVVLNVLSYLEDLGVFVERFEDIDVLQGFFAAGRYGHVESLVFLYGEAQSHEFGLQSVGRRGLCIQT